MVRVDGAGWRTRQKQTGLEVEKRIKEWGTPPPFSDCLVGCIWMDDQRGIEARFYFKDKFRSP